MPPQTPRPTPGRPQQGPQPKQGRIDRCPCPYCDQPLNFSAHVDADSGGMGWGEQGLEKGAKVECEHCGNTSTVIAVEKITLIRLAP